MYRLPPRGTQIHFDPPFHPVPARMVLEAAQIKIRAQLPVDARQQIHVERCRYAGRIVVSQQLQLDAFLQVCAEQQRISRLQNRSHLPQKCISRIAIEIADGAAQKQHQQVIPLPAPFGDGPQPFEIWLLVPYDADHINLPEFFRQRRQRRRRNLNRVVIRLLPPRERLQDPPRLFPRAASQLRHLNRRGQPAHNFARILFQQSRVSARKSVLRQDANRFKQRRAHFVVQIF